MEENKKIPLPPSSPKKEKNWTLEECMLSLLFPKLFVTSFGLG
jgi:hypothetical protein